LEKRVLAHGLDMGVSPPRGLDRPGPGAFFHCSARMWPQDRLAPARWSAPPLLAPLITTSVLLI
jgi:hypothetical protein